MDNLATIAEIDIDENLLDQIEIEKSSDRLVLALCAKIRELQEKLDHETYCMEEFQFLDEEVKEAIGKKVDEISDQEKTQ